MNFNSVRNIITTTNFLNRKGFNTVEFHIPRYKKEYKDDRYRINVDDTLMFSHKEYKERQDNFILDAF